MAELILRNLEDQVVHALERRAARHGRSIEAEHREILEVALASEPTEDPKSVLLEMPAVGDDGDYERIRELPRSALL